MAGSIGKQLAAVSTSSTPRAGTAGPMVAHHGDGPLMVVPAGFVADLLGGLSGTIGEITGGFFGHAALGKKIGESSSSLVKLLPFQVIPPTVQAQSAGPGDGAQQGSQEPLVVVPAGFLGGLLGGIGGSLLGGTVGRWLGNEGIGKTIGSTLGSVGGGLLPFQVVPPALLPQSAGPDGAPPQEPMVVVPAGFFGNLLGGLAGTVGDLIGGSTGRTIGETASPFIKLLPFQDVPSELVPQSAGPDGSAAEQERMILVPAGFFGSLLSGLAGTVGGVVGGLFGDARTGKDVGDAVAPVLDLLPFHAVPPDLLPQAAGPDGTTTDAQEQMIVVPAGLFGNLLSGLAGTVGGVVGGLFGSAKTGKDVGDLASPLLKLLPFHTIAPQSAPATS